MSKRDLIKRVNKQIEECNKNKTALINLRELIRKSLLRELIRKSLRD